MASDREEGSGLDAVGEFFDDRICQNFPGDALDFGVCRRRIGEECIIQGELEVLSLTNVSDTLIVHATQRTGNRLTLRVEHRALQRDIHMRFHRVDYRLEATGPAETEPLTYRRGRRRISANPR